MELFAADIEVFVRIAIFSETSSTSFRLYHLEKINFNDPNDKLVADLTVFAIFFNPWYSFFSRMLFLFKSSSLNFHSTTWWSPMLPRTPRDFECSAWKMLIKAVLNITRSLAVHFLRGALLLAGDERFWFPAPPQFGRPCFVCVFWIGFPCAFTHQHPLFSKHWIGA